MTTKFHIRNENGFWYVNDKTLQVPTMHVDGYSFSIGKEGRLTIAQTEDRNDHNWKLDIRVFQNGRFTSKVYKDSEECGYLKKYVETPINGYVFVSKNEKGVYSFYREEDMQQMMESLGVDSIKSKPTKSFFINDKKWKIYDGLLSGKMVNKDSFISVISSGEIKKFKNDAYIYIDFSNVELEKRYAIVRKKNCEGLNDFESSILYVDNQMLTSDLYDEIRKKEYRWYQGNSPEKVIDERNKQIRDNYKRFTQPKEDELEFSSEQLNKLNGIIQKLKRRFKNR